MKGGLKYALVRFYGQKSAWGRTRQKKKDAMGIGMGRDVERAIGALSTLIVGVGILVVRGIALSLDLWLLR